MQSQVQVTCLKERNFNGQKPRSNRAMKQEEELRVWSWLVKRRMMLQAVSQGDTAQVGGQVW